MAPGQKPAPNFQKIACFANPVRSLRSRSLRRFAILAPISSRFRLQLKAPIKNLEGFMKRWRIFVFTSILLFLAGGASQAQTQSQESSSQPQEAPPDAAARGTRFLVSLQTTISTKEDKVGKRFLARTLEPIATAEGATLPRGTQIRGHVDRVQSAGKVGRARLWLTFDEIHVSAGWVPLVADLIDAPGVHSIRVLYDREGEIRAAQTKQED